jgi:hypothetical protein
MYLILECFGFIHSSKIGTIFFGMSKTKMRKKTLRNGLESLSHTITHTNQFRFDNPKTTSNVKSKKEK